jgi:putative ABC transport system permease protein
LGEAISGHVYIFIIALMLISTVMAVVGGLGLMSSMGTSVIERTREFGVMRAIGARSATILRNIISEGVFIGLMSWVIALPLSVPLSLGIDYLLGMMSFRSPLPLIISPIGLVIWASLIIVGSIAASAYPARQASRLTVRETLAYV